MDARQAAEVIREHIAKQIEANDLDPAERHRIGFLNEVCHHLKLEPHHVNHSRVMKALDHFKIEHGPKPYPKWVKGNLVETQDEEMAVLADESIWKE